ncbi:MAG: precorrin-3B C17-methyltransferase [Acidimicrobiia bacterium]|nr:precorrin-3B C17-methyltransferase [Acidimicrobiia bacterium]
MSGRLTIVGLGPGQADWCTPAVREAIASATDLVGYDRYLELAEAMVTLSPAARRHGSDNRVEADRARLALDLAAAGGAVVVVSSGDPGIFAMASAVLEQLDASPERWREVAVEVLPGITAAQAVASRVGAPLGHDFCVISLSDVLKPWAVIEQRLEAAAGADFVIALYNPRSRHRPHQFAEAMAIIGRHRAPSTPVIVGRNVGRPDEQVRVVELKALDPTTIDMSTVVVIGSSTTRILDRPQGSSVYTPRTYPGT